MKSRHIVFALLASVMLPCGVNAQNKFITNPRYGQDAATFLTTQGWQTLNMIRNTLHNNPPCDLRHSEARKMALFAFDGIIHNKFYDKSECLSWFINTGVKEEIDSLAKPVEKGLLVCKVYNDGYVIKSPSTTIAFDLCGREGTIVKDTLLRKLVDCSDALFISHHHSDHADSLVIREFLAKGKPVITAENMFPEDQRIIHIENDVNTSKKIKLRNGKKISFTCLPGHQNVTQTSWVQCLHNVVTFPEGYTVAHIGDQAHNEDMPWIQKAKESIPRVDLMFVTAWMGNAQNIVNGYDPKIVFTGHENEMGHPIETRIPFWYAYHQYNKLRQPVLVMGWTEMFHYVP